MTTILITSAGSLVCDAILRCLAEARRSLTIVGVNSVPASIAFGCDRLYRVPPTADAGAYDEALRRILARERPAIVLPGRDDDVPALAGLAALGEFPETAFPVPPPALAPVFVDKRLTHRFARDHGLPFAPTAEGPAGAEALAREHGFPLLVKPWRGAGSRDVFLTRDAAELAAAAGDARMMAQAFLGKEALTGPLEVFQRIGRRGMPWNWAFEDEETTVELTIGPSGAVSSISMDRGTTAPPLRTDIRLVEDEAVASVGLAWAGVLAAHGHRGPINIQGKRLSDGRFVPYEVGARFGGTSVARAALGCNQILHLVAEILGWPVPDLTRRSGTIGLTRRRTRSPAAWWRRFDEEGEWRASTSSDFAVLPDFPAPETPEPRRFPGGANRDRLDVWAYARRHGLPFASLAATLDDAEALIRDVGLPLIAKPRWGDGPVFLVERRDQVAEALADGAMVVQSLLDDESLAAQRTAWNARPGPPWTWTVTDRVDIAEAEVTSDGRLSPVRTASRTRYGGDVVDIRPTRDPAVMTVFRRWAEALIGDGLRESVRITGKRGADGVWLPFSVSPVPLGLPIGDIVETRLAVPHPGPGG